MRGGEVSPATVGRRETERSSPSTTRKKNLGKEGLKKIRGSVQENQKKKTTQVLTKEATRLPLRERSQNYGTGGYIKLGNRKLKEKRKHQKAFGR